MAAVDENAEALGVPRKQLMESSGNAVARAIRDAAEPGANVAIVAGRGNNGGDAFVAARFLDEYDVTVHLLGRPETISTTIARENWDALERAEYDLRTVTDSRSLDLGSPDVIVDAMLGTGVKGSLREPEATAAAAINGSDATVVSVDVPSGVDADTGAADGAAVEADRVVTFHDAKPGLADLDAEVTVADIGIPAAAELFVGPGDLRRVGREAESHKGENGDVLVIGGGPFSGAPALSAMAVLRAGGDLANVACPESVAEAIKGYEPDLIVHPLDGDHLVPDHVESLLSMADGKDVVVIGPGLGDAAETTDAVRRFLSEFDGTAVVDADALRVVPEVSTEAELICTPHQGELRDMGGETSDDWRERTDLVEAFAAELGHVLLVKSAYDVISDGERTRVSRSGNPGMTVGGTGDVLAGATAALAAVHEPFEAAAIASYANGRAGDLAFEKRGYGFTASQMVDELPLALGGETDV
ncbi:NAD(P)H-hydrate dehydratase [Halegenticoccus soli]|uniref:NAD(P)H-hydrate dehydratase n=1 Tax=Halegenticoccus soli TaxID=1985678 RepID=UPI0018EAD589